MSRPILSIIVPVYNTEKFLYKCLESIKLQTFKDFEVIIVNDHTPDNSLDIINEFINKDGRFKLVSHNENKGLFQARITGFLQSKGSYIAHVDSDDYVSIDWFRNLIESSKSTNSDIVLGNYFYKFPDRHSYYNLGVIKNLNINMSNEYVFSSFIDERKINFSWSSILDKLYTRDLWEKSINEFINISKKYGHIILWEDVMFNIYLFYYANKITNIQNIYSYYYYCQHANNSTNNATKNSSAKIKNIQNTCDFLNIFEELLKNKKIYMKYKKDYLKWKEIAIVSSYNMYTENGTNEYFINILINKFNLSCDFNWDIEKPYSYLHKGVTYIDDYFFEYENIKKEISNNNITYICFDIFNVLVNTNNNYYSIRESIKELYDLALYLNKKIILNSNNNKFTKNQVIDILKDLGINNYTKLFLNVDLRQEYTNNSIIINTSKIPSTKDIFEGNSNIYVGDIYNNVIKYMNLQNKPKSLQSVFNMINNKLFDNPFDYTYNMDSDFNLNPSTFGYQAVGSHLLSFCIWLENKIPKHIQNIYFDESMYLYKEAFKIIFTNTNINILDLNNALLEKKSIIVINEYSKAFLENIQCDNIEIYNVYSNNPNENTFYETIPKITGFLRDVIFYKIYDKDNTTYEVIATSNMIQKNSLDFIKDYISIFNNKEDLLPFKNELSAIFDYFLNDSKAFDRNIYAYCNYKNKLKTKEDVAILNNWLFSDIYEFIKNRKHYKNLVCFGLGATLDQALKLFKAINLSLPVAYCDNNKSKQGKLSNDNVPVISFDEAINNYEDLYILITNERYMKEIKDQVLEKLPKEKIKYFTMSNVDAYIKVNNFNI